MTLDHPIFTRWPTHTRSAATLFRPDAEWGEGRRTLRTGRSRALPALLVVFDRLASIEPGAPDIFQVFLYRALEVARPQACSRYAVRQSRPRTRDRCPDRRSRASTTLFTRAPTRSRSSRRWTSGRRAMSRKAQGEARRTVFRLLRHSPPTYWPRKSATPFQMNALSSSSLMWPNSLT